MNVEKGEWEGLRGRAASETQMGCQSWGVNRGFITGEGEWETLEWHKGGSVFLNVFVRLSVYVCVCLCLEKGREYRFQNYW